jgi:cold shock CspA family protein
MYCSNPFDLQCAANGDAEHLRYFHKVFQRHNVTMSLGAHIHLYERSYPLELEGELTHFKNLSTSLSHSIYENPDGITFISEGAGGNDYFVNRVPYPIKEFTATTIQNTGYGIIELQSGLNITYRHFTALNCTEVDFVQIFISTKNLLGV